MGFYLFLLPYLFSEGLLGSYLVISYPFLEFLLASCSYYFLCHFHHDFTYHCSCITFFTLFITFLNWLCVFIACSPLLFLFLYHFNIQHFHLFIIFVDNLTDSTSWLLIGDIFVLLLESPELSLHILNTWPTLLLFPNFPCELIILLNVYFSCSASCAITS